MSLSFYKLNPNRVDRSDYGVDSRASRNAGFRTWSGEESSSHKICFACAASLPDSSFSLDFQYIIGIYGFFFYSDVFVKGCVYIWLIRHFTENGDQ